MSRRSTLVAGNPWLASLATLVTWAILGAPGAFAQFHQVRIVIDADNDPATGCSVDLVDPASPSGFTTFHGSEFTAIVEIDPLPDPPDALNPRLISCPPFSGTPETTPLPDANEVEADLGYKGSDAVALQIPMEALGYPGTMRLAVESKSAAASTDLLLAPGGQVILFDASTVAPGPIRRVRDFPGNAERLTADQPSGVEHVIVNGVPIQVDGKADSVGLAAKPGMRPAIV